MKKHWKIFSVFCLMMLLIITGCTNSKVMYTIRFNTLGGSSINSIRYNQNDQLTLPTDPVKQGYEFDGWYLDRDYNQPLVMPYTVTKSLTLFAKWNEIKNGNLVDIEFDTSLVKTTYNALDTFDITNLKITEIYDSGSTKVIENPLVTTDKTVLHGNDTKVIVTYGDFSKEIEIEVNKLDYDLSGISFNSDTKEYSGNEQTLIFTGTLPQGLSAKVTGSITNVGQETITLEFTNLDLIDYNTPANLTAILKVTPKTLEDAMFDALNDVTYNGEPYEPKVNGKFQDTPLVIGTDYTVTYSNNINVGVGKAVINGTGNFMGEVTKTFKILNNESDLDKVLKGKQELETKYSNVLNDVLNKAPEKLVITNTNGTTNSYYSSTTAFIVDNEGNVSVVYKDVEQDVTLTVIIRCNDTISYLQFNFKLPKVVTKMDTTTKIEVDNVVDGVTLEVKELTETETANIVVKDNEDVLQAFNINLLDESLQKVEPSTTVTVKIPISKTLSKTSNLAVYYVSDNGTLENMNAKIENGYLVFTTNHFSIYIVTAEKEQTQTKKELSFDFTSKGYENATVVEEVTSDTVTITFSKGTNNNSVPMYYTNGTAVRTYGGNKFTITSEKNIISVKLFFSSDDAKDNAITASSGTFTTDTWTGEEKSVTFTVSGSKGHRKIQKIVVTIIDDGSRLSDEEIVKKEINLFTINSSLSNGYSLPTNGKLGSKITWRIDSDYLTSLQDGKLINNTDEDLNVTIFAKFTYGEYTSAEQAYNVTIRKTLTSTDVDTYYEGIVATSGEALKEELRDLLTKTHTKITSYDDCKKYLQEADEDPNNSDNMLLFYTGTSITKTANMSVWNREHVWCQSLGWFSTSGAGADLHHIRPCNIGVNSSRGNKKFGVSSGYYTPSDEYKGDVARIIFYLLVRYSEADNYDFTAIVESLDILLKWNELDPVSETEIIRNNYIYTIQGNRNPFIDNAEYADLIWGNK